MKIVIATPIYMNHITLFLKNFTSGDIETIDDVTKMYDDYEGDY